MADVPQILRSIHDLSLGEKQAVLAALEVELGQRDAHGENGTLACQVIGLFAGQDELMDQVMQSVYENRERPWRAE
jgi:hypothetical protein